jgi:hypothetical protein
VPNSGSRGGTITAAVKKLGISRHMLHRKINEMNFGKKSTEGGRGGRANIPGTQFPHSAMTSLAVDFGIVKIRVYESRFERFN